MNRPKEALLWRMDKQFSLCSMWPSCPGFFYTPLLIDGSSFLRYCRPLRKKSCFETCRKYYSTGIQSALGHAVQASLIAHDFYKKFNSPCCCNVKKLKSPWCCNDRNLPHAVAMSKSLNAHDVVMTKKLTSQFCCRPVDVPVGREQLHVLQHQVSCLQLNLRLSQGNNSSSILTFNILAFALLGLLLR